jgi:methyl coenzyme M reductase subunit D
MKTIIAKVLIPSFEVAVNEYLKQPAFANDFERGLVRETLSEVWEDNSHSFAKYVPKHLLQPETTEVVLEDVTRIWQNYVRVMWKGKVEKICEIDSIVSYIRK